MYTKNIAQQSVVNPVTEESTACMTTEKRASFLWAEKGGGEGCKDIKGLLPRGGGN